MSRSKANGVGMEAGGSDMLAGGYYAFQAIGGAGVSL